MFRKNFIIIFSFFIAVLLSIVPFPDWMDWLRPEWVVLVLIYWLVVLPYSINLWVAWLLGLFLDMLGGTVLGEHALALSVVAFLASRFYRQIRVFPVWQQTVCVFFMVMIYQMILFVVQGAIGQPITNLTFWLTPIISMVLWPWLFVLLRNYRRRVAY